MSPGQVVASQGHICVPPEGAGYTVRRPEGSAAATLRKLFTPSLFLKDSRVRRSPGRPECQTVLRALANTECGPDPPARQMEGPPGHTSASWAPVSVEVGRALPSPGSRHFSPSDLSRVRDDGAALAGAGVRSVLGGVMSSAVHSLWIHEKPMCTMWCLRSYGAEMLWRDKLKLGRGWVTPTPRPSPLAGLRETQRGRMELCDLA